MTASPVLDRRALNRAVLARQGLLARERVGVVDMVTRLVGLQGQDPDPPYVGLWCRLEDFAVGDLEQALTDGTVVRGMMMRGTQHLVTPDDFVRFRRLFDHVLAVQQRGTFGKAMTGVDLDELVALAVEALRSGEAHDRPGLGRALARRWPDVPQVALARTAQHLVPLLHPPPDGFWQQRSTTTPLRIAEDWLGRTLDRPDDGPQPPGSARELALRYFAAFGPASVSDLRAWSGMPGTREVVAAVADQLVTYRDPEGRTLYDVPGAPVPDPSTPAPVRFLAALDNVVLGHHDRSRMLTDEQRKHAWAEATVTVDGFVRAVWGFSKPGTPRKPAPRHLLVRSFGPLTPSEQGTVTEEGDRLLRWAFGEHAGETQLSTL